MFGKAINQLFSDVAWGETDICIVDLPPGTGDAQLSLAQMVKLDGVLMVTTPGELAVADVRRAINMFKKVDVPVFGLVENMAGFEMPDGSIEHIFGEGGADSLQSRYGIPILGSLPLKKEIRVGGDQGEPFALSGEGEDLIGSIASEVAASIESLDTPELEIVN